jgi:hypothetical protein
MKKIGLLVFSAGLSTIVMSQVVRKGGVEIATIKTQLFSEECKKN